jgi:hypothetical protein
VIGSTAILAAQAMPSPAEGGDGWSRLTPGLYRIIVVRSDAPIDGVDEAGIDAMVAAGEPGPPPSERCMVSRRRPQVGDRFIGACVFDRVSDAGERVDRALTCQTGSARVPTAAMTVTGRYLPQSYILRTEINAPGVRVVTLERGVRLRDCPGGRQ